MTPEEILALRTRLGLNRSELARKLRVSPSAVTRWETGENRPKGLALLALRDLARQRQPPNPEVKPRRRIIVPEKIVALRTQLGLRSSHLARRLRVNPSTVMHWEAGHHQPRGLGLRALRALARQQGISLEAD